MTAHIYYHLEALAGYVAGIILIATIGLLIVGITPR